MPGKVTAVCKYCSKRLNVPDSMVGQVIKCPACHGSFRCRKEEPATQTAPEAEQAPPPELPARTRNGEIDLTPKDQPSGPFPWKMAVWVASGLVVLFLGFLSVSGLLGSRGPFKSIGPCNALSMVHIETVDKFILQTPLETHPSLPFNQEIKPDKGNKLHVLWMNTATGSYLVWEVHRNGNRVSPKVIRTFDADSGGRPVRQGIVIEGWPTVRSYELLYVPPVGDSAKQYNVVDTFITILDGKRVLDSNLSALVVGGLQAIPEPIAVKAAPQLRNELKMIKDARWRKEAEALLAKWGPGLPETKTP